MTTPSPEPVTSSPERAAGLASPRIGGVTYLNAWPILYGLMLGREPAHIRMAYPSVLAERLIAHDCDLALAPVTTLALRAGFELAPGICIGAEGEVASVLIVAERPIEDLSLLLLDSQSKTSVVLAQLVATELRRGRALPVRAYDQSRIESEVQGATGAVVIGDRALVMRERFPHVIDLAAAWQRWTGLPFVFAAWIAQRGLLDDALVGMLDRSLEHIRYRLDERYRAGLREFLARAAAAGLLESVELRFFGA